MDADKEESRKHSMQGDRKAFAFEDSQAQRLSDADERNPDDQYDR